MFKIRCSPLRFIGYDACNITVTPFQIWKRNYCKGMPTNYCMNCVYARGYHEHVQLSTSGVSGICIMLRDINYYTRYRLHLHNKITTYNTATLFNVQAWSSWSITPSYVVYWQIICENYFIIPCICDRFSCSSSMNYDISGSVRTIEMHTLCNFIWNLKRLCARARTRAHIHTWI
jgi:hypothetical protein